MAAIRPSRAELVVLASTSPGTIPFLTTVPSSSIAQLTPKVLFEAILSLSQILAALASMTVLNRACGDTWYSFKRFRA